MAVCNKCGRPVAETDAFCGNCGAQNIPRAYDRGLQEECLHTLYRRLCTERKCWRIFAFVFLGITVFFSLFGLIFIGIDVAVGVAMTAVFLIYALVLFLPITIINFVVVSKLNYYISTYYTDIGPTIERCGSPGAIVLGALCNEISLIFIIINFVYIKRNADVFKQIRINQLNYINQTTN